MAILKIRQQDGTWAVVNDPNAIKYIEQELTEAQKAQARTNIGATELKRDFKFVVNGFIMSNWTCEIVDILGSYEDAIPLDSANLMGAQHWYAIYDYGAWAILGATASGWIPFQNIWTSGLPGLPTYTYGGIVQELPEKTELLNKVFVIEQFIAQDIDISAIGRPGSAIGAEEFNHLTNSATGMNSHAEGEGTQATGYAAHAEGQKTVSSGNAAHAEGYENIASGYTAHAEGRGNNAEGDASHVEGIENDATGEGAHAEGKETDALGARSHAEGYQNVAEGEDSHAEGYKNLATGGNSHVEGLENVVIGNGSHAEGMSNTVHGGNAHAEGARNVVFGQASHAEGWGNKTYECGDHAEGYETRAGFRVNSLYSNWQSEWDSSAAHAEGTKTRAEGLASHAEGSTTIASGNNSHAGGSETFAFGDASVAVGVDTFAAGRGSFASGYGGNDWNYLSETLVAEINPAKLTTYSRSSLYLYESDLVFSMGSFDQSQVGQFVRCCPVEPLGGYDPVRLARITGKGQESWGQKRNYIIIDRPLIDQEDLQALEENNITSISIDFISNPSSGAIGNYSHTEGNCTIAASDYQHVQGKFNIEDNSNTYAHIVGKGTSNTKRSNAHTLDWKGNAWFAGDVYVGCTSETNTNKDAGSKKLATEDAVNAVKTEIDAIKNGETFIPTLQMGQEKSGLNFIDESGKWDPNPSGNYWSGWNNVNDVLELEDGSTVTVNTWQLKGMWLYGNNYLHILITPQGIFERDLYVDSSYKRQQSKWRKYSTTTDVKTKTSVTIGGIHQEIFNADTKLDKLDNTSGLYRMPFVDNNNIVKWSYLQSTLNTATGGYPQPMVARYFKPSESWANQAAGGVLYSADPTKPYHVANKNYVDTTFVNKAGDTITGDLTITGNLQIKGISETVDAVTYKVENNLIEFNPDKTYNNTWLTGIAVNKGIKNETDLGTYGIMYDPHVDSVKLGFGIISENHTFTFNENESAPIATREEFDDSWEEDEIFVFDKDTKKFKHSGKTLSSFKKEIQDEMKDYIANYIETYMSTEIEVDSENEDAISLYANGKTKEVMTEDGNLWLYVGGTNE